MKERAEIIMARLDALPRDIRVFIREECHHGSVSLITRATDLLSFKVPADRVLESIREDYERIRADAERRLNRGMPRTTRREK